MDVPGKVKGWHSISFAECFRFPVSSPEGRRDILIGGTLLFTLLVGWIFNLGHRLEIFYRLHQDQRPCFAGFAPWGRTFRRGCQAFAAICLYLSPAGLCGILALLAWRSGWGTLAAGFGSLAALFFLLGIFSLPGGMTYNAALRDMSYLYRPDKAFRRALDGGTAYLKAWCISLCAISLSFLGPLGLGVGFFYTSVWAWIVVGYAFSKALLSFSGVEDNPSQE